MAILPRRPGAAPALCLLIVVAALNVSADPAPGAERGQTAGPADPAAEPGAVSRADAAEVRAVPRADATTSRGAVGAPSGSVAPRADAAEVRAVPRADTTTSRGAVGPPNGSVAPRAQLRVTSRLDDWATYRVRLEYRQSAFRAALTAGLPAAISAGLPATRTAGLPATLAATLSAGATASAASGASGLSFRPSFDSKPFSFGSINMPELYSLADDPVSYSGTAHGALNAALTRPRFALSVPIDPPVAIRGVIRVRHLAALWAGLAGADRPEAGILVSTNPASWLGFDSLVSIEKPPKREDDSWFPARGQFPGGVTGITAARVQLGSGPLRTALTASISTGDRVSTGYGGFATIVLITRELSFSSVFALATPDFRSLDGTLPAQDGGVGARVDIGHITSRFDRYEFALTVRAAWNRDRPPAVPTGFVGSSQFLLVDPTIRLAALTVEPSARVEWGWDDSGFPTATSAYSIDAAVRTRDNRFRASASGSLSYSGDGDAIREFPLSTPFESSSLGFEVWIAFGHGGGRVSSRVAPISLSVSAALDTDAARTHSLTVSGAAGIRRGWELTIRAKMRHPLTFDRYAAAASQRSSGPEASEAAGTPNAASELLAALRDAVVLNIEWSDSWP